MPRTTPLPRLSASACTLAIVAVGALCAAPGAAQDAPVAPAANPATYRASVSYEQTRFDSELDPWHLASIELSRRSDAGTFLLRGNQANRFGTVGRQLEAEAYPRLGERVYAYLGVGASPDEIFPELRYGAELFVAPVTGAELSVGVRRLDFSGTAVTLYTGSAGWYAGNHYLAVRPFLAEKESGTSASGTVLARRYFRDADDWVGVRLGAGETPAEELTSTELERLGSWRAALEGKRPVGALHLRGSVGYEREEIAAGRERGRFTVGVGLERRF